MYVTVCASDNSGYDKLLNRGANCASLHTKERERERERERARERQKVLQGATCNETDAILRGAVHAAWIDVGGDKGMWGIYEGVWDTLNKMRQAKNKMFWLFDTHGHARTLKHTRWKDNGLYNHFKAKSPYRHTDRETCRQTNTNKPLLCKWKVHIPTQAHTHTHTHTHTMGIWKNVEAWEDNFICLTKPKSASRPPFTRTPAVPISWESKPFTDGRRKQYQASLEAAVWARLGVSQSGGRKRAKSRGSCISLGSRRGHCIHCQLTHYGGCVFWRAR